MYKRALTRLLAVLFMSCADGRDSRVLPPAPPALPPVVESGAAPEETPARSSEGPTRHGSSDSAARALGTGRPTSQIPPFPNAPPEWLCGDALRSWSRNRGGSSITFQARSESGAKVAFKPDQRSGSSRFRAEIGVYRVSSMMGYGRVPPSCERTFPASLLFAAAGPDSEFRARLQRELRVSGSGTVRGAAIEWVSGLRPLDIHPSGVRRHPLATQLSDMIWFDELVGNWDRWSGGNVFTDRSGLELVLIDNAAAFAPIGTDRRRRMDAFLDAALAPSAAMQSALRSLGTEELERATQGVGLTRAELAALIERRDRILSRLPAASGSESAR